MNQRLILGIPVYSRTSMAASLRTHSLIEREHVGLLLGVFVSSVGLFHIVGPVGIGVAIAAGAVTRFTSAPFGVGVIHVGALISSSSPELLPLVLLESGSALFVVGERDWINDVPALVGLAIGAIALSVPVILFAGSNGIIMAASALVIAVSLLAYGLHRYERVRLGLVPEEFA